MVGSGFFSGSLLLLLGQYPGDSFNLSPRLLSSGSFCDSLRAPQREENLSCKIETEMTPISYTDTTSVTAAFTKLVLPCWFHYYRLWSLKGITNITTVVAAQDIANATLLKQQSLQTPVCVRTIEIRNGQWNPIQSEPMLVWCSG
nr:hypothetical protein HmN_000175000 [Hymenolepis microstoma]